MTEKEKTVKKESKKVKKTKQALFEVSGGTLKRKNRYCPKCGPGVFMATHKDRFACGRCSYTEWKK